MTASYADSFAFRFGPQTGAIWQLNKIIKVAQSRKWLRCMVASPALKCALPRHLHQSPVGRFGCFEGTKLEWTLPFPPFIIKPAPESCPNLSDVAVRSQTRNARSFHPNALLFPDSLLKWHVVACICMKGKHGRLWSQKNILCGKACCVTSVPLF